MNTDSILQSMRKFLTGNVEDDYYDPDLIMYINSVLVILDQIGDSMPNTMFVTGINETWTELIPDEKTRNLVKSYVTAKVRKQFDPPTNSSAVDALDQTIAELEWRINVISDKLYQKEES